MNQGDAAIWAAGMGIAGTLAAALGGPLLQARAARRQTREQEKADVRQRLREERQTAFKAVLDASDAVQRSINAVIETRVTSASESPSDEASLWSEVDTALDRLYQAATLVAITGPAPIGHLAETMLAAADQQAGAWRPRLAVEDCRAAGAQAITALHKARHEFILRAQEAMSGPGDP
ncbi:hypothetical protein H4K36_01200 [Streptomyces sp. DHE7-1]|nr:hypothetical protein [Streptomyces sp. DHE7-1]